MDGRRAVITVGLGVGAAWMLALLGGMARQPERAQSPLTAAHPLAPKLGAPKPEPEPSMLLPPHALALQRRAPANAQADEHPHPISAEHVRLRTERQLIAAMNDALDLRDGAKLRTLVERYAEDAQEDSEHLQQGYRQLAECIQNPGPDTTRVARAYYENERASVLRRYIRRLCLESGER